MLGDFQGGCGAPLNGFLPTFCPYKKLVARPATEGRRNINYEKSFHRRIRGAFRRDQYKIRSEATAQLHTPLSTLHTQIPRFSLPSVAGRATYFLYGQKVGKKPFKGAPQVSAAASVGASTSSRSPLETRTPLFRQCRQLKNFSTN